MGPLGEERRKRTFTDEDAQALAGPVAERILADERSLDLLADKLEEKLWEGWYISLGKILLRATGMAAGAIFIALLTWATAGSMLGKVLTKVLE